MLSDEKVQNLNTKWMLELCYYKDRREIETEWILFIYTTGNVQMNSVMSDVKENHICKTSIYKLYHVSLHYWSVLNRFNSDVVASKQEDGGFTFEDTETVVSSQSISQVNKHPLKEVQPTAAS